MKTDAGKWVKIPRPFVKFYEVDRTLKMLSILFVIMFTFRKIGCKTSLKYCNNWLSIELNQGMLDLLNRIETGLKTESGEDR